MLVIGVGALFAWANLTWDARATFADHPEPAIVASTDPEVIARGRYLVHGPAHCAQCHTADDRNDPGASRTAPLDGGFAFHMGPIGSMYAANLTSDATGLASLTDGQIARAIRHGIRSDGSFAFMMRFAAARPADEDLTAVISYLRTVPPVRNEVPRGGLSAFGKVLGSVAFPIGPRPAPTHRYVPAEEEPSAERGEYLANAVALCVGCHTAVDMKTFEPTGPLGAGGTPERSHGDDKDYEYAPPNLTSHPTGYTGKVDEEAFVQRFRAGRVHLTSIMPWESFLDTTESDIRSIYRYLKSLPPVDHDTGPSYRKLGSFEG